MGTWSGSATKEAPSNEGASFIGSSHSLTGVRSTTVFKCVATPSVKWCYVLLRGDFKAKIDPIVFGSLGRVALSIKAY